MRENYVRNWSGVKCKWKSYIVITKKDAEATSVANP